MVNIISQADIDSFNIDTVERSIVFGAMALQTAISQVPDNQILRSKVRLRLVAKGKSDLKLQIDVRLPFEPRFANKYGGKFFHGVSFFDVGSVRLSVADFNSISVQPTPNAPTLPRQRGFGHFERYFYYYCETLFLSLTNNRNEYISIVPTNNYEGPELKIKVLFPVDTSGVNDFNLIEVVPPIVTNPVTPNNTPTSNNIIISGPLTNSQILTNNTIIIP